MDIETSNYNTKMFIEISNLERKKTDILSINNILQQNNEIKKWMIEINKKLDVFSLGVLLKRELNRLLLIDKQHELIIGELNKYVLNNMLNINSFNRSDIITAYNDFKNICVDNGINDIYLRSVNSDDII
jgi:hypothetical protein